MCYGYTRCESVEGKGQFARRGDIVDVFVPSEDAPTRIEYFGDEVDTVNYFDIMTQRRTEPVGTLDITPTREILITESEADIIRTKITEEIAAIKKKLAKISSDDVLKKADLESTADRLHGELEALSLGNLPCTDKYLSLIGKSGTTLLDYTDGIIFAAELPNIKERIKNAIWQVSESVLALSESGENVSGASDFIKDFGLLASEMSKHPTGCLRYVYR